MQDRREYHKEYYQRATKPNMIYSANLFYGDAHNSIWLSSDSEQKKDLVLSIIQKQTGDRFENYDEYNDFVCETRRKIKKTYRE